MVRGKRARLAPVAFLALPLLIFIIWIIVPTFRTIYLSFTNESLMGTSRFVGLQNYIYLFGDPAFLQAVRNNVIWIFAYIAIPIPIGFLIALGLDDAKPVGCSFLRVLFYVPMAISLIAVGLMWTWMYNPSWGIINTILRGIGLESLARQWLGDQDLVLFSVIVASYWNFIPLIVIILGAGLTQIPNELIDAARIDGTSYMQQVLLIKIPLLRPSFTIATVITVIFSLRVFDIVFATTGGGPVNASEVLGTMMYQEAFRNTLIGYGASIATVQTVLTLVFIILYLRQLVRGNTLSRR